jgi:recombinational DNA repair protein RecR
MTTRKKCNWFEIGTFNVDVENLTEKQAKEILNLLSKDWSSLDYVAKYLTRKWKPYNVTISRVAIGTNPEQIETE